MICLLLYCSLFSRWEVHQVVKYAYQQITDLCYRETKAITAPIPKILFILVHLFKGTERICEMMETLYGLSNLRAVPMQSGLWHRGDVPICTNLMFMNKGK